MTLEAAAAEAAAVAPQAMIAGDLLGTATGTAAVAEPRDAAEDGTELEIRLKLQDGGCKSEAILFNDITTPFEIIFTASRDD
ncbi:hypothetical protein N7G274_006266 [Stereocaulon virgatum]|uniref:Uncharacterized protein n=1 Tax=Stereocaulon virgatum TaxID=373712 RepID=A0ABR4ABT0_9LECA